MQFSRFAPIAAAATLLFSFACDKTPEPLSPTDGFSAGGNPNASSSSGGKMLVRWDVGVFDGSSSATASSGDGGIGARITFTGSGTFRTNNKNREDHHVTGGGTWQTNTPSASGTYKVTALLSFHLAPGTVPPGVLPPDLLPDNTAARAGLAFLRIRYSDGTHGILVVSCRLVNSPPGTAEGISASKGFVDFWRMEDPDFTLFQIVNKHDDDD
jgi:hypothetical protein